MPSQARIHGPSGKTGSITRRRETPIGSGPFLLVPVDRGRQFTLVRNPRYWGPHKAYLDRLVFRFLPPPFPGSGIEAMRGGTVDALIGVTHDQEITAFCREGGVKCVTDFSTSWDHIAFRNGPGGDDALKQRSVRQAIAYAIDRDALVRQLYPDLPRPAPGAELHLPARPALLRAALEDLQLPAGQSSATARGRGLPPRHGRHLHLFRETPVASTLHDPGPRGSGEDGRARRGAAAADRRRGADLLCCASSALRAGPPGRRLRPRALPVEQRHSRSGRKFRHLALRWLARTSPATAIGS